MTFVKNHLTLILFLIGQTLFSQNDIPGFEFGHKIDPEFYYEFIDDNVPFINLTQDKFFVKREKLKISKITVMHIGMSCDTLYLNDIATFKYLMQTGSYDHGYSYIEILTFDKRGYKISKHEYPICKFLTKKDSILCDQRRTDYIRSADSLIVSTYFKDTINEKAVYLDKIEYRNTKDAVQIMTYDSINKGISSKVIGYKFFTTKYSYANDGKILRIDSKNSQKDYNLNFNFSSPTLVTIKCSYKELWGDSVKNLENRIVKNNLGQIVTSTFYYTGMPNDFSCYSFTYDKHNNLSKVNRRRKANDWFDYTEKLYSFNHNYQNNKLTKTIVHYNFRTVHDNIIYIYNDKGLISELDIGTYKLFYHYYQD